MKSKAVTYLTKILVLFKNGLLVFSTAILSFFIPIQPLVVVTTVVALFDWFLKIYCVYKTEGKAGIKSNKMQDTFFKIILYAAFLGTLFVVDQLFFKTLCFEMFSVIFEPETIKWVSEVPLSSVGTLMILLREGKSIDENWESAFGISPINIISKYFGWLFKWKNSF